MGDPAILIDYIVVGILGLCFGSFATALIYRIPRNIPWIYDKASSNKACRSACPSCGHVLTARDLVPLFSWLASKGKCRHCGKPVSMRYPAIELVTMIATLAQFHAWGLGPTTIPVLLSVPFLVAALIIDWEHMILPDDTNIALTVLAIIFVGLRIYSGEPVLIDAVSGAILLTAILWLVSFVLSKCKGRPALGAGDLKFLPAAGLFMGMAALPTYIGISGLLGLVTAGIKAKTHKSAEFPFGPALIISLYLHVILTGLGFDYTW